MNNTLLREELVNSMPLHQFVASAISERIAAGEWEIGSALPSESSFCQFYGVSRHTLRHALGTLEENGLILRRQGAPTRVISRQKPRRFAQSPSSPADILRCLQGTYRVNETEEFVECDAELSNLLRSPVGSSWFHIGAIRREQGTNLIVAWTDIYVLPRYADVVQQPAHARSMVYQQIEDLHGVKTASGEVNIYATGATAPIAKALQVPRGSPCLAIERRYVDAKGETYEVATAYHPESRFVYSMEYRSEE
jgi:DNA-binding GntR family transcriptional regulator